MDIKLALEYRAVALRPEQLRTMRAPHAEMSATLDELEAKAQPVQVLRRLRPISTDPNDDMIIELAVAASVDAIVTNNVRHLEIATIHFGIPVLTPAEFLHQVRRK